MPDQSMIEKWSKWLSVTETSVVRKSYELHRLLELKTIPQINANNQCIICVDIAAEMSGSNFDSSEAVRRSNLSQSEYLRQKRMVLKLLGLNTVSTCANVCMQLNCKQVQKHAERLLNHYREQSNDQTDFSHPQYVCMAIFLSCKQQKVKIKKSEILAKSTLKSAQWAQLEINWSQWMKKNEAILNDQPVTSMEIDEEIKTTVTTNHTVKTEVITESYEAWKERILKIAYAELEERNKQGQ